MSDKCKPDHWFLKKDETVDIILRETFGGTGIPFRTTIPQGQLLGARANFWKQHNRAWQLPQVATPELVAPYTSGNEVKDLVDGEEFMGDLLKAILEVDKDDFALIAGWEFWRYRALDQRVINKNPRVDDHFLTGALAAVVKKQANVRVLAFDNIIPGIRERMGNFLDVVTARYLMSRFRPVLTNHPSDFACRTIRRKSS